MRVECSNCHRVYDIPEERLPLGKKVRFPCPSCGHVIELDLRYNQAGNVTSSSSVSSTAFGEGLPGGKALKKKILATVGNLPPMWQVVHKARQIMENPNSSFKDLAITIVTDQAIAARVLRLANSAYYGLSERVSSIQQASVILGYKTLAELLALASTSEIMGGTMKGYGLNSGELWQHSLAVAFGSRIIAKKRGSMLLDDAFAAGLLHDAGKIVLDEYIFERLQAFKDFMADGQESFVAAEKEILGFDHAEIASEVCKSWNVPQYMATGIRYHHCPSRTQRDELAYILHVADVIAMMSSLGTSVDTLSYELEEGATEFLGLKSQDISKIMAQVVASVQKTMEEFQKE